MSTDTAGEAGREAPAAEVAKEAIAVLRNVAEQLEVWADASVDGGWSTHQVAPMRAKAREIRSEVRRLERRLPALATPPRS